MFKPRILRLITELESAFYPESNIEDRLEHPESSVAEQKKFRKHLDSMCNLANDIKVVNPFKETGSELITSVL